MHCFDIYAAEIQMAYKMYCYAGSLYLQDERSTGPWPVGRGLSALKYCRQRTSTD
jgi:hypothetical protein